MLKFLFISCQITGFGSSKRSSTPRSSRPTLLCQCSAPRDVDFDDDDKEAFCVVIENEIGNHLSHSQVPSKEFWIITLLPAAVVNDRHHYSILSYSYAPYTTEKSNRTMPSSASELAWVEVRKNERSIVRTSK